MSNHYLSAIRTSAPNKKYSEGWDNIFGKKETLHKTSKDNVKTKKTSSTILWGKPTKTARNNIRQTS